MIRRLQTFFLFAGVLGFFIATFPANHSEAEDAYYYSRMAEQGGWPELFHAHHLLYLPLMRSLFRIIQFAGYDGRSFAVLAGVSLVSGALAVCLFSALLRRAGAKAQTAGAFTAALLFSYGFWRYSTTVEIYMPAVLLSLLTFYCAMRGTERKFFRCGILCGGAALLVHLATIPPVLFAAPLLYVCRRQKREAACHAVLTLLTAGAVYGGVIAAGIRPVVFADRFVQRGTLLDPLTWLKGAAAWGQTVLSGNFLFSLPDAAEQVVRLFPFQMLQEELFMGRQAAVWVPFIAPATFLLTAGLAAGILITVLRFAKPVFANQSAVSASVFIWLAAAAAMALLFEPSNPEMWICVLPPLWLLAALLWNPLPSGRLLRLLPFAFAAVLPVHNWTGGMQMVKSPDGDYCRQKGAWAAEETRAGDLIVTADSHSFMTFLEYETPASVLDAKSAGEAEWRRQLEISDRVFVFDDVINPLPPVSRRLPAAVERQQRFGAALIPGFHIFRQDAFGTVYEWKRPDPVK